MHTSPYLLTVLFGLCVASDRLSHFGFKDGRPITMSTKTVNVIPF